MKSIDFSCLCKTFPGYVFWAHFHEIYGYNPDLNQFIVIDDGMCQDPEGEWCVWIYKVSDKPTRTCFKDYKADCEECLFEERIKLVW